MSTSQLKLALTRDPRASAIMRPVTKIVSTSEVKLLPKSPNTENVGKPASKSRTPRTLPFSSPCFSSSPRQAILKLVPAIIKVDPDTVHASKDSVSQQQSLESHSIKKACSFSQDAFIKLLPSANSPPPLLASAQPQPPTSQPSPPTSPEIPPFSSSQPQPPTSQPPLSSSPLVPPISYCQLLSTSKPLVASSLSLPTSNAPVAPSQLPISKPLVASSLSLPTSNAPVAPSKLPISKHLVASSLSLPTSNAPVAPSKLPISKPLVASSLSLPTYNAVAPSQLPISESPAASSKPPYPSQSPPIGSVPMVKPSPLPLSLHPPLITEDEPSLLLCSSGSPVVPTTLSAPVPSVINADDPQPKKARRQSAALLPISRVRTIMKAKLQPSKTGQQLGKDSVPIITRAAELFIAVLAQGAEKCEDVGGSNGQVTYKQLATSVNGLSKLQFLHEILPHKVVAKDYLPSQ